MFESQKISFENFLLGYKHGVYIFTRDTCDYCERYKQEISYINSHYLFFVEVTTAQEMALVEKILNRSAYPITAGYEDNVLKFCRIGIEFETQQAQVILPFLKKFPPNPLTPAEIERRIEKQRNRCMLTYYAFADGIDPNKIMDWQCYRCSKFNELPINISTVGLQCSADERFRLLEGQLTNAKLVVFTDNEHKRLGDFEQKVVIAYANANPDIKFISRDIDEQAS